MSQTYVFDACAMIALLSKEEGYQKVEKILENAKAQKIQIVINIINLYEVYYKVCKTYGEISALNFLNVVKKSQIKVNREITDDIIIIAGNLKKKYKMSLADSIGLAETITSKGAPVRCV